MTKKISGVILAGGASKRFNGIIKAKIVIGGKTILTRIIETFDDLFDEIILVTNTPDEFREYGKCKITSDQFLNKGPLGGIHSALKETESEAAFVFAGDMPMLERELIVRQIAYFNSQSCDILIPRLNNYIEPLHGIYSKRISGILEKYLESDNNYAIREFFKKTNVLFWQFEESESLKNVFTNINSPDDVEAVIKLLGIR